MRYRSNRQYLYPVLRPDSDDYGEAQLHTTLDQPQYDAETGELSLCLRFHLLEESLVSAVRSGDAKCTAMVYCRSTLQRMRLDSSAQDPLVARGTVPVSLLKNQVEVHPVILATRDIVHSPASANSEDQGQTVEIRQWAPMATDLNWTFNVDPKDQPVRGIFRLVPVEDDHLRDGQFDIQLDVTKPYVDLTATQTTIEDYKETRKLTGTDRLLPTIFNSAVISVLSYIKDLEDDDESETCEWVNCVRNKLEENNIRLGDSEQEGTHTLFLAAQLLLESPFSSIFTGWEQDELDDLGEEEGVEDSESC